MKVTTPPPKFPKFSYHVTQIWPLRCQWKSWGEKDPIKLPNSEQSGSAGPHLLPISLLLSSFFLPGS